MPNNLRTASKFKYLIIVVCLLMAAIGVHSVYQLNIINRNNETLYHDRVIPLEQLTTIRYSYASEISSTIQQIKNNQLNSSAGITRINEAKNLIKKNWDEYKRTYLTSDEHLLLANTEQLMSKGEDAINRLVTSLNNNDINTPAGVSTVEVNRCIDSLTSNLSKLISIQINTSNDIYSKNKKLYRNTKNEFYIILIASIIFTIVFSYFILADNRSLINQLKTANEELRISEEKCRVFIKYAGDGILILNPDFQIIQLNESICTLLGYNEEELLNLKITDLVHIDDQPNFFEKVSLVKERHASVHERRLTKKDGSSVETEVNVRKLADGGYISIFRDISERKKIYEKQSLLTSIIQSSNDAIISKDLNGTVTSWNAAAERIFGYSADEMLGKNILVIIPTERQHEEELILAKLAEGKTTQLYETQRRKKDGTLIDIELTVSPIKNSAGSIVGASKIARDITSQKQAARTIRKSEEQYRYLFNNSPAFIMLWDTETLRVIDVNEAIIKKYGYTREEWNVMTVLDYRPKEDHERIKQFAVRMRAGDEPLARGIWRHLDKAGNVMQMEITSHRVIYNQRNAILSLARDITEQLKAEKELKESEEKFRTLIEQTPAGVFIFQNQHFLYVNPGFENLTGYKKAELVKGYSMRDLIHEDDLDALQQSLDNDDVQHATSHFNVRLIRNDGAFRNIEIIVSNIIYNDAPASIGSFIDVTERLAEEARINKAVINAQENERTQIGMELHDNVKQILAASLMFLEIANKNLDNKPKAYELIKNVKQYVNDAIIELRRLSHRLAPSASSGKTMAAKISELVNNMNAEGTLNVTISVNEAIEECNRDLQLTCYRIIQEQFSNIIKYAAASSAVINLTLNAQDILLYIKDDGIGFDPKVKKEGIGLENISRRVKAHGGKSKIVSSPGKGCAIEVQLPAAGLE